MNPTVFIHYSWDSENHKKWVLNLANRLIKNGVDVFLDRFDLKIGSNLSCFMEKVVDSTKVLIIATENYKVKPENREGGVGYEFQMISGEISKISKK